MKKFFIWLIFFVVVITVALLIGFYADLIDRSDIIVKYKTDPLFCLFDKDCTCQPECDCMCPDEAVNIFNRHKCERVSWCLSICLKEIKTYCEKNKCVLETY